MNDNVNHKTIEAYLKLVIVMKMTISEKDYLSRKYNATLSTPIKCQTCSNKLLSIPRYTNVMLLYTVVGHTPQVVAPVTVLDLPSLNLSKKKLKGLKLLKLFLLECYHTGKSKHATNDSHYDKKA